MPVVQRMQRPYPHLPEMRAAPARQGARAEMLPVDPDVLCSLALLLADMVGFALALCIAGLTVPADDRSLAAFAALVLTVGAGGICYALSRGHYEQRLPFWAEARDVGVAAMLAAVLAAASAFFVSLPIPRTAVLVIGLALPVVLLLGRQMARLVLSRCGLWRRSVLIVGDDSRVAQAEAMLLAHKRLGYDVVARVGPPEDGDSWSELLRRHEATMVALAPAGGSRLSADIVTTMLREQVPYTVLPAFDGLPVIGRRQTYLGRETVMVSYRNNLRKPLARAIKVAFDLTAAAAALLVLAPVMLLVSAVVGLDGGPVFYAHTRIGARGRVFRCLKFRSMVVDSETALQRLFQRDPQAREEWARTHKLRRDPRITRIGAILRKTSLDELPQLLNVLRLEMSLVGPRPIVSLEIPKYGEDIAFYYETRPGITGLWQVSGRSDTTYAQRVGLDSYYVKNWSLLQDLAIILRTIPAVISGRGAG